MPALEHVAPVAGPLSRSLRSWAIAALDLVFPALCPVCASTLAERRRDPLCGACWDLIPRIAPPWCDRCGLPARALTPMPTEVIPPDRLLCGGCRVDPPGWDWARAGAEYDGVVRDAIHAFKFRGKRALARPLAALIGEQWPPLAGDVAALVPVPLGRPRQRERGFNQAALLAERLAPPSAWPSGRAGSHGCGIPSRRATSAPPKAILKHSSKLKNGGHMNSNAIHPCGSGKG